MSNRIEHNQSQPTPQLLLASRSPRRVSLLTTAGLKVTPFDPGLDDSTLRPGAVTPAQWTVALAHLKARSGLDHLPIHETGPNGAPDSLLVIGADTVVQYGEQLIGQPRNEDHARTIIRLLRDDGHDVITGVALIHPPTQAAHWIVDTASVHVGSISDYKIDEYVATGDWRGKAGAYNLIERLEAGWPIQFTGDPATIMGLPMIKLLRHLKERWKIEPCSNPEHHPHD